MSARPVLRPLYVALPPEVRELLAPYPGESPAAVIVRALRLLRLADRGASAAQARGGRRP
ncbi:hypothetical protein [Streptomyces sp. DW26H14]|uniref:hypothetical protein n=1 Tax=Streptomyces sp. DW26H14 TaxID=3435395 RepID=UPI00403D5B0D